MNEQFIQDNFCDSEVSQMLKEVGFNEPCLGFYNETGVFCRLKNMQGNEEMALYHSAAPLYQQACAFLRAKGVRILEHYQQTEGFETLYFISRTTNGSLTMQEAIKQGCAILKQQNT